MTLHVSLPQELENKVHDEVNTGMYQSASEVVREALRRFFNQPSEAEVMAYASRLVEEAKKNGGYQTYHDDSIIDKIMQEEFGDKEPS